MSETVTPSVSDSKFTVTVPLGFAESLTSNVPVSPSFMLMPVRPDNTRAAISLSRTSAVISSAALYPPPDGDRLILNSRSPFTTVSSLGGETVTVWGVFHSFSPVALNVSDAGGVSVRVDVSVTVTVELGSADNLTVNVCVPPPSSKVNAGFLHVVPEHNISILPADGTSSSSIPTSKLA